MEMTDFPSRFHILKPEKGFEIAPWNPDDAKIYFGDQTLSDELWKRIEAGYNLGRPPKIYLQGRWGAGKTHHLYHLRYVLEKQGIGSMSNFITPYMQIECADDTSFQNLHRKMMNSLGLNAVKDAVSEFLMAQGAERANAQRELFGSSNLVIATQVLSIGDDQLAWRWLCGENLNGSELKSLNVTSNLGDTTELVDVLIRIGRLFRTQDKCILFFIDEGESLKNITKPNAQSSWHDGLRNLADNLNNSIGFIISIFVDSNNPSPEFINEDDILRRIGQRNIVEIEPYAEPSQIEPFMKDLLKARIKQDQLADLPDDVRRDYYPFQDDALDLFINELLSGAVSATPSKIIEGVSECAWEAHSRNLFYITADVVQEVMPRVTAAV